MSHVLSSQKTKSKRKVTRLYDRKVFFCFLREAISEVRRTRANTIAWTKMSIFPERVTKTTMDEAIASPWSKREVVRADMVWNRVRKVITTDSIASVLK